MTNNNQKIIGIDARLYGEFVGRGLGRYIREVVDGVIAKNSENKFIVFLSGDNYDDFDDSLPHVEKVLVKSRWYSAREQFELPYLIKKYKIDLMHFPHFNVPILCTTPFIVTIHDLILTKFPTPKASTLHPILYKIKDCLYRVTISKAVRKSLKIIAISVSTKDDLVEQFNATPDKISVIYEGVSKRIKTNNNDDNNVNLRYNLNEQFLLYVGSAYPHKNLETLVKVFKRLSEKNKKIRLLIVGREDYFFKRLKHFAKEFSDRIIFPGYVTDSELSVLYKNADAFVFPSLYEGFGLPPLEAMSYGCPVVSSDASCMPEILGTAASYFDPEKEDNMLEKIKEILGDEILATKLIESGYQQLKKYSWEDCVNKTDSFYQYVLKKI